jgi:hypothetical protein
MSVSSASLAGRMTTVYGPACTRRDPLTLAEATQVNAWRARGLGWDACAKMVGRSTPDVRAHCDPGYERPYQPARPVAAEAAARKDEAASAGWRQALRALDKGARTSSEIAIRLHISTDKAAARLSELARRGLARKAGGDNRAGFQWEVTEAGVDLLPRRAPRG